MEKSFFDGWHFITLSSIEEVTRYSLFVLVENCTAFIRVMGTLLKKVNSFSNEGVFSSNFRIWVLLNKYYYTWIALLVCRLILEAYKYFCRSFLNVFDQIMDRIGYSNSKRHTSVDMKKEWIIEFLKYCVFLDVLNSIKNESDKLQFFLLKWSIRTPFKNNNWNATR